MDEIQKAIKLLQELFIKIKQVIENNNFEVLTSQQKCAEVLFCDIFYLTENCITILEKNKNIIGLPILIRSLFERCIDIFLLCFDAEYLKNIQLCAETESKIYLKDLKKNPSFDHGITNIDKEITEAENVITKLKQEKVEKLSFKKKVTLIKEKNIGDFDRIYIYYRKLSAKIHSNFREMLIKYAHGKKSKNLFKFPIFSEVENLVCINFTAQILLYSFNEMMKVLNKTDLVSEEIIKIAQGIKEILSTLEKKK